VAKEKPAHKPDPAPLEVDDVLVVSTGTVIFLVVGLALLPFWDHFKHEGHLWWIASCFAGAALGGLIGLPVVVRRRARLRSGLKR
jgi:hypothetical protein